jgi:hypothetical protein
MEEDIGLNKMDLSLLFGNKKGSETGNGSDYKGFQPRLCQSKTDLEVS